MATVAADDLNKIIHGDCVAGMNGLEAGSVDLVFADPPFNIGYEYDEYDDRLERDHYLDWSREWISAVHRVLSERGTFWLAIGDEYAAELKIASQEIGFHCRSWVIWYYTFGVNCSKKFSRSHAHLFHFVKDPNHFTFREKDPANRVPSARQLVYNDKRANSKGRLPDDTWIIRPSSVAGELREDDWDATEVGVVADEAQTWTLRPQDLDGCFQATEDTWYFPRVAGTFKERAGFHGCQMPEQLLGRIVRCCSDEGQLVLDPFSGSATTLAVAKKLGRQFVGFDMSEQYVEHGQSRLDAIRLGDRLDGSPEPLVSAPDTKTGRKRKVSKKAKDESSLFDQEQRFAEEQLALSLRGIGAAFAATHDGYSADRLVADPDLSQEFFAACERLGIVGDRRSWSLLLFRLRKSGHLQEFPTTKRTKLTWADCDPYLHGSEIAMQSLLEEGAESIDEILCDPDLAARFDELATSFAPGFTSFEYRWAALKIRKQAKTARNRAALLTPPRRLRSAAQMGKRPLPETSAVYVITDVAKKKRIYVGETLNLRVRMAHHKVKKSWSIGWKSAASDLSLQFYETNAKSGDMLAWQSCFVKKYAPRLNYGELVVD
jgi:site-specific DNA-methyltransferase (adenine-specific)